MPIDPTVKAIVTTEDTCSNCGAKLTNAETARLEWQQAAADLSKELAELQAQWKIVRDEYLAKADTWLSPDEAKALRDQLAQAQAALESCQRQLHVNQQQLAQDRAKYHGLPGWLSPDEAAKLRTALHDIFELASNQKSNRDCAVDEGLIATALAAVRVIRKVLDERKDEAAKLQAQLEAMREALKSCPPVQIAHSADAALKWADALNGTAGTELIEKLERYEKALVEIDTNPDCDPVKVAREALKGKPL